LVTGVYARYVTVSEKQRRDKRHAGARHGEGEAITAGREPLGWLAAQLCWERRLGELRDQAAGD